ncbi:MAG TPA: TonB-dependent receptor, partial [Flavobacterium sp.]
VNGSLATRNPNPSEFFSDGLHHSLGVIELGDLRLQKEQALKVSTTVQKKWNAFQFMLNPFVNYIQNYMFLRPIGIDNTIRGTFPVWQYEQTNARLIGVDLQTNWDINNNWKHTFSLAYVNGKDLNKDQPLIDMPPLNLSNSIRFSKKEWQDLVLILKSDLVFRQTKFPDFNFQATIIENGELTMREVDISTPPPAYHLLDFYSEIKMNSFKNAMVTLAFSVQNVLNTNYRDYLNRQRLFTDEMGRNFQLQIKINY